MGQILCAETLPTTDYEAGQIDFDDEKKKDRTTKNDDDFSLVQDGEGPPQPDDSQATADTSQDEPQQQQQQGEEFLDPLAPPSSAEPANQHPRPERHRETSIGLNDVFGSESIYTTSPLERAEMRREQSISTENDPRGEISRVQSISTENAHQNSCPHHQRTRSDGILSMDDANRLHKSWSTGFSNNTESQQQDLFGSSSFQDSPFSQVSSLEDQTEHTGISSAIHDAARITNWLTVKELCGTLPEAASYVGRDRWTALHHACNRRCPFPDVVEALIKAYPDALVQEEDKGWLPLHYACRFKAPKDVVRLLLQMDPEKGRTAVTRLDRQSRTPLFYAVRYGAPPGVVGLLLEVDATAVLEEDQNADSPLATIWDSWAEKTDGKRTLQRLYFPAGDAEPMSREDQARYVHKRLETQQKLLERWNKVNIFLKAAFGFSVDEDSQQVEIFNEEKKDAQGVQDTTRTWRILHGTAAIKCHPSLFMLAITLQPEQASEIDNDDLRIPSHICSGSQVASNLTALHLAASSRANGDHGKLVLNELLNLNPDAADAVDTEGSLPLHRIVENKHKRNWSFDGAKEVYLANNSAVRAVDLNGKLPLHRACVAISSVEDEFSAARSAICNLLDLYPDGAAHSDHFGCLPLHLVAQYGSEWDFQIDSLYNTHPEGARQRTGVNLLNRLPLHMAAANTKSCFSLINNLAQANPRGASQADRKGMYPLHLACECGLSWECIKVIYETYPQAVQQLEKNSRGWTALQMAAACPVADEELLTNLARIHPESASVTDSDGRSALHLACLAGKKWNDGLVSLFEANPDAARTPDQVGLLPFHVLCFRYSSLLPESPMRKPGKSGHTPRFSKAASFDMELATLLEQEEAKRIENLFHILKADPTVLSTF